MDFCNLLGKYEVDAEAESFLTSPREMRKQRDTLALSTTRLTISTSDDLGTNSPQTGGPAGFNIITSKNYTP